MKMKKVLLALLIGIASQSASATNYCDRDKDFVTRNNFSEEMCKRASIEEEAQSKEIIMKFLSANQMKNYGSINIQTDTIKTAHTLAFMNDLRMHKQQELDQVKEELMWDKVELMINVFASAKANYDYFYFIHNNQMPDMSKEHLAYWQEKFEKVNYLETDGGDNYFTRYNDYFEEGKKSNSLMWVFTPIRIAEDLMMRIKTLKSDEEGSRNFDMGSELKNIEFDLNALAVADIYDPKKYDRDFSEASRSLNYAIFIRDAINSYLVSKEQKLLLGELIEEKKLKESQQKSWDEIEHQNDYERTIYNFDHVY